MFQENITIVIKNNSQPSLSPSWSAQKQRLRLRQDPPASASSSSSSESDDGAGSVTSIVSRSFLASSDPTSPVTLPISISVGVSTPPPIDNTESSTSDTSSPSSSDSVTDTSSASSSDSSLPSSSESPSTSSSESPSSTFIPPSTTTQPPYTRLHTLPYESSHPPMSSQASSSSGPTVTDTTPSPPTSSSISTSTMSSSVTPPPTTSSSSSGAQESTSSTDTSTTPTSTSVTQTSTSISTSTSGRIEQISPTSTITSTPPSTSDTSTSTPPDDGSSSTSASTGGPSSADRTDDTGSTTGSPSPPTTTNGSGNPVTSVPRQSDSYPTATPMTTLSTAVSFMTTDASGSTLLTVPPEFTTVIVTTLPGGTFTTITEVVANPPGILNPGDVDRDSVAAFFQNKGAVAGVFIAASLAICAIILFVVFALRRRRSRFQNERDAEIAAGLAAAASNQRFADDEDHPVVMRNVPAAMRGRSPWLDDDDEDRLVYNTATGPVMYSNLNGVGPPTQGMPIISEVAYPLTAARYTHARTNSASPSPKRDSTSLPITSFEPVSPTGNSGWSSHGGAAHLGRESSSPVPTSAPASANHGTAAHAPSVGHAPSSYGGHRPPASAGRDGTGSGSGGTSQPSLMTATPGQRGASSSKLEDMYPPEYEQYSQPNSSAAVMGYAYEPDPVPHEHQITTDLRAVRGPHDGMRSPPSANVAMSVGSRSMYSHEGEEWDEEGDVMPHEDSRLDPVMRMTGGLASAASVGPRDHEDYTRRVVPQPLMSPSTASNSHSMSHSHSTH